MTLSQMLSDQADQDVASMIIYGQSSRLTHIVGGSALPVNPQKPTEISLACSSLKILCFAAALVRQRQAFRVQNSFVLVPKGKVHIPGQVCSCRIVI